MRGVKRASWSGLVMGSVFGLLLACPALGAPEAVAEKTQAQNLMEASQSKAPVAEAFHLSRSSQARVLTDEELDQIGGSGVVDGFLFISVFGNTLVDNRPIKIPEGFAFDSSNSAIVHISDTSF